MARKSKQRTGIQQPPNSEIDPPPSEGMEHIRETFRSQVNIMEVHIKSWTNLFDEAVLIDIESEKLVADLPTLSNIPDSNSTHFLLSNFVKEFLEKKGTFPNTNPECDKILVEDQPDASQLTRPDRRGQQICRTWLKHNFLSVGLPCVDPECKRIHSVLHIDDCGKLYKDYSFKGLPTNQRKRIIAAIQMMNAEQSSIKVDRKQDKNGASNTDSISHVGNDHPNSNEHSALQLSEKDYENHLRVPKLRCLKRKKNSPKSLYKKVKLG